MSNKITNVLDGRKVNMKLVGRDGNIFSLLGSWGDEARKQGFSEEDYDKVSELVFGCKSYHEALAVLMVHTDQKLSSARSR